MRVLFLHSDFIEVEAKEKAIKQAEEIENKFLKVEEALVVFISVEEDDKNIEKVCKALLDNIKDVSSKIKVNKIVLYPYVHLTNKPSDPETALNVLVKIEELLRKEGFEVYRAPFGWYKSFTLKVKGHPLSELSREIKVKEKEERKIEKKYLIVFPDGSEKKIEDIKLDSLSEDFRILVEKEALGKELGEKEPTITKVVKKFGFEWEEFSDYGHMRYKPYATLIVDLVKDYAIQVCKSLDIPIFVVSGTNMFDLKEKPIKEHAKGFGERMYNLVTDKSNFVLRYAACFQQFSIAKDLVLSYKHLPFGMLELADSYRYEQPGECVLCFRTRKFTMPDLHVFCKSEDEVKEWFLKIHEKIIEEIKKLGRSYELLINVGSEEDYENCKDIIVEISKRIKKPVLVCIYTNIKFYWVINIEYHLVDVLKRPREIGTVQIDVGNAKRFGIMFVDENGEKKYPYIIHTAIIGSVERYIYTLFDTALRKEKPCLPLWISPVQVRIIPVSDKNIEFCYQIANELVKNKIRVEVDDRNEKVGKKILEAEKMWVPYIIVIGDKEVKSKKLSVRKREENIIKEMTLEELIKEIKEKVEGFPFRESYWPISLSKNVF